MQLRFQCETASLLIPGDPALIQKLLLTLISNSAKPARSGEVTLTLERRGGQALLWLGDRGRGRLPGCALPPERGRRKDPGPRGRRRNGPCHRAPYRGTPSGDASAG